MMDWTDRHCRYFHRLLSEQALLYTEMVTAAALVRGGALHLLEHDPAEHPVALQLGGADPAELAHAALLGAEAGFGEINLNVGCPSDRVQSGAFGAVLMERPALVADCVKAMRDAVDVDVTVKCRIGVDAQDPETVLPDFLQRLLDVGCRRVIVHARKAWLKGLSPKENRDIPPLDYDLVHRMKARFPELHLSINGGVGRWRRSSISSKRVLMGSWSGARPIRDLLISWLRRINGFSSRAGRCARRGRLRCGWCPISTRISTRAGGCIR